MDDEGIPMVPIAAPLELLFQPPGTYGISYDINTSKAENNLSEGQRVVHRGEL